MERTAKKFVMRVGTCTLLSSSFFMSVSHCFDFRQNIEDLGVIRNPRRYDRYREKSFRSNAVELEGYIFLTHSFVFRGSAEKLTKYTAGLAGKRDLSLFEEGDNSDLFKKIVNKTSNRRVEEFLKKFKKDKDWVKKKDEDDQDKVKKVFLIERFYRRLLKKRQCFSVNEKNSNLEEYGVEDNVIFLKLDQPITDLKILSAIKIPIGLSMKKECEGKADFSKIWNIPTECFLTKKGEPILFFFSSTTNEKDREFDSLVRGLEYDKIRKEYKSKKILYVPSTVDKKDKLKAEFERWEKLYMFSKNTFYSIKEKPRSKSQDLSSSVDILDFNENVEPEKALSDTDSKESLSGSFEPNLLFGKLKMKVEALYFLENVNQKKGFKREFVEGKTLKEEVFKSCVKRKMVKLGEVKYNMIENQYDSVKFSPREVVQRYIEDKSILTDFLVLQGSSGGNVMLMMKNVVSSFHFSFGLVSAGTVNFFIHNSISSILPAGSKECLNTYVESGAYKDALETLGKIVKKKEKCENYPDDWFERKLKFLVDLKTN